MSVPTDVMQQFNSPPPTLSGSPIADVTRLSSDIQGIDQKQAQVSEQESAATQQTMGQLQQLQPPQQNHKILDTMPWLIGLVALGGKATGLHARTMLGATNGMVQGLLKGQKDAFDQASKQYEDSRQKLLDTWKLQMEYYNTLYRSYGDQANAKEQAIKVARDLANDQWNHAYKEQLAQQKEGMDEFKAWYMQNSLMEKIQSANHTQMIQDLRLKMDQLTGTPSGFDQEKIDYYARQQLAGDTTWRSGLSRTKQGAQIIAAVDRRVPEIAKENNISPEQASTQKEYRSSLGKALNDRQKYVAAGQQFTANFQKQADLVEKYLNKGVGGSTPVFNRWIQAGRKQVEGDTEVNQLDTAIRGLAREHQRIVTGVTSNAQLHSSAQATADELLNKDMTAGQIKATLTVMREEANNAVTSGRDEVADLRKQLSTIGVGGKDSSAATLPEDRKTLDGKTYEKRGGKWYEVSGG